MGGDELAGLEDLGGDDELAGLEDLGGDKPFDDEPFDAEVEADEDSEPKKYIQQLAGKLGQSLRKHSDEEGSPDLELEKFAVNSVLSATHTGEMDDEDQKDIIKKVKTSGKDDEMDVDVNVDVDGGDKELDLGDKELDLGDEELDLDDEDIAEEGYTTRIREGLTTVKEHHDQTMTSYGKYDDDEYMLDVNNSEPKVAPSKAGTDKKADVKVARRSKPWRIPTVKPNTGEKPQAVTEATKFDEMKPQNIWWENDPNDLLRWVYWNHSRMAPLDPEKKRAAFINVANQLNAKYPAPEGSIERLSAMVGGVKGVTEATKFDEMKPQNIWWENDPNDLLRYIYWTQSQMPPLDPEKKRAAFINIENQLNVKYPAPEGSIERLSAMIGEVEEGIGSAINKLAGKVKGVSDQQKAYNKKHGLPSSWQGSKKGYEERMNKGGEKETYKDW
jgi:hypothetical protein